MDTLSTAGRLGRSLPAAGTRARSDLRWVAVATLLAYVVASTFDAHEWLAALTAPMEAWQLDELPFSVGVLWLGLAWYAWRRWIECARLLADNRELARQLIAVQERERVALARELHDQLAQECTAIRIEAAWLQRAHDASSVRDAADRCAASATRVVDGLRDVLRKLRPAELDELGLASALRSLAASHEQRAGMACRLAIQGVVDDVGPTVSIAVYRVAQEALSNVARHSQARTVRLTLIRDEDALSLEIEDDGCGFDPASRTRGLGLLGVGERAAALGGHLVALSAPGAGTTLRMSVPVQPSSQEAS
jgi:two-component system sensor histidine kinase UhpB